MDQIHLLHTDIFVGQLAKVIQYSVEQDIAEEIFTRLNTLMFRFLFRQHFHRNRNIPTAINSLLFNQGLNPSSVIECSYILFSL